jgi:tetraacyldisaccharide 4'-kinase
MRPIIERLWQRELPSLYRPFKAALIPLAMLYSGALAIRARWWRGRAVGAGVAIISVGNLTVGGNGKTPLTLFIAKRLLEAGYRTAIVSRGYGRHASGERAALVSDGARVMLTAREAGDEPVMMAQSFKGPIAVARRRLDGIRLLSSRPPLDVVILDDGFQHLRLRRDLDLLVVNETRGFGNGWVLPAGPLREGLGAIRRADAVIVMSVMPATAHAGDAAVGATAGGMPGAANYNALARRPVIRAALAARSLVRAENGHWRESPIALCGRRVVAVSGLANADGFHGMIRALGAEIAAVFDYPDHHEYSRRDWEKIVAAARGAELVLTTEKDLVKLEGFSPPGYSLYALRVEVQMDPREERRLLEMIIAKITRPAPEIHGGVPRPARPAGQRFEEGC